MRIHNIYVDDAGETHWRDIEVHWVEERNGSSAGNSYLFQGDRF